jgi:hypothetical protein
MAGINQNVKQKTLLYLQNNLVQLYVNTFGNYEKCLKYFNEGFDVYDYRLIQMSNIERILIYGAIYTINSHHNCTFHYLTSNRCYVSSKMKGYEFLFIISIKMLFIC